jgi:hypothetical protein
MSDDKKKVIKATSPRGTIQWFKLVKPDAKFNKYSVDLIVDDTPEIRKIIDVMESAVSEKLKGELAAAQEKGDHKRKKMLTKAKQMPIEPQLNAAGEETGKFVMKFRLAASGTKKDKTVYTVAAPAIFDSKAKPYSPEAKATLQVFNGSIGQINFELSTYALATGDVGCTLKPKAAMVLKIQQGTAEASDFGFAASEFENDSQEEEFQQESASESTSSETKNEDF